ncbi:MAG: adenosine deaminase family protein, partial [Actinomycetota bacterium]
MSDKDEVLGAVAAAVEEASEGMPDGMMDIESAPLGPEISLDLLARRLPKSELHLHFEGAIPPATVGRLARHAGMPNPAQKLRPDSLYDYRGFAHFIDGMRDACALMTTDDAVIEAALDVFARGVDAGARHIELMTTLGYHIEQGRDPRQYLAALGRAFAQAAEMWGMSGGIIVEFDRPAGPGPASEIANIAADARDAGVPVLAVGNDGDPLTLPFRDLAPAYEVARSRGLKLTGHADLPDDITAALELGLDRIDHGFFAIYDQGAMDQLVAKQIPMTLCITS